MLVFHMLGFLGSISRTKSSLTVEVERLCSCFANPLTIYLLCLPEFA